MLFKALRGSRNLNSLQLIQATSTRGIALVFRVVAVYKRCVPLKYFLLGYTHYHRSLVLFCTGSEPMLINTLATDLNLDGLDQHVADLVEPAEAGDG